ncbi:MAG TPA: M20/M25/M40 family metallo-hydrolase [Steroidobacteraceae bacterium]|nr:M20/M25/M40 family metallo-hydrolase [Steroidobacteraceae bacterium]
MKQIRRGLLCALMGYLTFAASVAAAAAPDADEVTILAQIRDAAMSSNWAWQRLSELTDRIGPRLSGSPQLAAAISQLAGAMRSPPVQVTLQPVKIPHWVRGEERAELVEYSGRPDGVTQHLQLTALGFSSATPASGLTAPVIVVHDLAELNQRSAEIPGNIVLFEARFNQRLADNGFAGIAYMQDGLYRTKGPAAAAALGAAAVLVRSVGGADFRLPHTGATSWKEGQVAIPAAALAAEDADLVARLAAFGPVTLKLVLTPRTLPEVDSSNVIADWPGREKPGEFVIVSGHLDSWDLATGATDDGVGVIAAAAVIDILRQLDLHPRRTIRFIGWTAEEPGAIGGKAYFASVERTVESQTAAIESDAGAGRSLGVRAAVTKESLTAVKPVLDALGPIGATVLQPIDGELGADISWLQAAGVPGFAPLVDTRHYFDYHHTAADTLDKVEPQDLRSQVATMAVLAYFLAELPETLPRFKIAP